MWFLSLRNNNGKGEERGVASHRPGWHIYHSARPWAQRHRGTDKDVHTHTHTPHTHTPRTRTHPAHAHARTYTCTQSRWVIGGHLVIVNLMLLSLSLQFYIYFLSPLHQLVPDQTHGEFSAFRRLKWMNNAINWKILSLIGLLKSCFVLFHGYVHLISFVKLAFAIIVSLSTWESVTQLRDTIVLYFYSYNKHPALYCSVHTDLVSGVSKVKP